MAKILSPTFCDTLVYVNTIHICWRMSIIDICSTNYQRRRWITWGRFDIKCPVVRSHNISKWSTFQSLWTLTGVCVTLLPRHPPSFKATQIFQHPILPVLDLASTHECMIYQIRICILKIKSSWITNMIALSTDLHRSVCNSTITWYENPYHVRCIMSISTSYATIHDITCKYHENRIMVDL